MSSNGKCVICGSELEDVLYFGIVYANDLYVYEHPKDDEEFSKMDRKPQKMKRCPECYILYGVPNNESLRVWPGQEEEN